MQVRLVVTGHDANGKAVFASDEQVDPITLTLIPGAEFHRLWGGNEPPSFPDSGARPDGEPYFPAVGGFRFGMFTVAPESQQALPADVDIAAGLAEIETKLPGLSAHMEPEAPGMHTTSTIDFEVVLDGEVWLELDDGNEVHLRPGDCVVQNGTRHAWRNHGSVAARLAVFLVGAHHSRLGH
ncbi:MAG TPA: cupin domain-containing protein [Acidimicrobiales bacterium]|nr:cupin domain-containing protein [Acidimicrobiales bacterium]